MTAWTEDDEHVFIFLLIANRDNQNYRNCARLICKNIRYMNKSTRNAIHGLTGQLSKLYDAIPLQDAWTISQIHSELHRNGSSMEYKVVHAVLNQLVDRGLVTQIKNGLYKRLHAAEVNQPKPKSTNMATAKKQLTPIEILAELAAKARQFANELDNAAIDIEQEFQTSSAQSKKLKQLQSLLKDIAE